VLVGSGQFSAHWSSALFGGYRERRIRACIGLCDLEAMREASASPSVFIVGIDSTRKLNMILNGDYILHSSESP